MERSEVFDLPRSYFLHPNPTSQAKLAEGFDVYYISATEWCLALYFEFEGGIEGWDVDKSSTVRELLHASGFQVLQSTEPFEPSLRLNRSMTAPDSVPFATRLHLCVVSSCC